jgi:hypothetical protein
MNHRTPSRPFPILAWDVERVYQRNRDLELLKRCLGRLERFHDSF